MPLKNFLSGIKSAKIAHKIDIIANMVKSAYDVEARWVNPLLKHSVQLFGQFIIIFKKILVNMLMLLK